MSVRAFALAAAAAVSTLVLAPLPAYAETITSHDPSGDVVSQGVNENEATHPEPARVEGDALSMRVLHGPRNVRVIKGRLREIAVALGIPPSRLPPP